MSKLLAEDILFKLVGGPKGIKKHDVGNAVNIVPFTTKHTGAIRDSFHEVLGEYIRNVCGLVLDTKEEMAESSFYGNPFVEKIISAVEVEGDAEYDLERFLTQYLFSKDSGMKPIHPYLFNYLPLPEKKANEPKKHAQNELKKHAQFLHQVLIQNHQEVASVFQDKDTDDILTELILNNLSLSEKKNLKKDVKFRPMLDILSQKYREDVLFLKEYREYFLNSFSLLTQFYAFMYICQLLWKFEKFEAGDYTKLQPLYFALEWESINKRRKAADEIEGYKRIRDKSQNLFVHVHTLSQLSHNTLSNPDLSETSEVQVFSYPELLQIIESEGEGVREQFRKELNDWIQKYIATVLLSEEQVKKLSNKIPETLAGSFKLLFDCLQEGMNTDACTKFGKNLEDVGGTKFLKSRGSLGHVFNMTHEMLILLTAVCVKSQRIPLNQLFEEYEQRGVAFDRQSKKEIVDLLDSLNMLDKKSDSGDAQYVKPIL